jgi:hypothetical protein
LAAILSPRHALRVYQLRIGLRKISPIIWRRLLVRSDSTIADLHYAIQIAMGWMDSHLHRFRIHGKDYTAPHSRAGVLSLTTPGGFAWPILASGCGSGLRHWLSPDKFDRPSVNQRLRNYAEGERQWLFAQPVGFGNIEMKSPRLFRCACQPRGTHSFSPLAELLDAHTAPERLYLEAKWAAQVGGEAHGRRAAS